MPVFLAGGIVLEDLFPLLQEPWVTDVALFGLFQFRFSLSGGDGEQAA